MPFSPRKLDQVQRAIRRALVSSSLTEWERNFLRNMQAKLSRFGCKTQLSDKQYRRLMQLVAPYERDIDSGKQSSGNPSPTRDQFNWLKYIGTFATCVALIGFATYKGAERFPEYLGPLVILTAI